MTEKKEAPALEVVKKDPDRETKKCTEYLKYTFTPEEKAVHADDLARNLSDLEQLRLKRKEAIKAIDSDITKAEQDIHRLAAYVKDGYMYRNIDCELEYDYTQRKKTLTRLDTGIIVRTIVMTADELQKAFDFNPDPNKLSKDKDA